MIFAIDPGTTKSGWVLYEPHRVIDSGVADNHDMLEWVKAGQGASILALEMVASYGMAVGKEVFETVRWVGRFQQAWHQPERVKLVYRAQVKLHLCKSAKANDANIRQALIDRIGPPCTIATEERIGKRGQALVPKKVRVPGPTDGISADEWAALAVAG